MYGMKGCWLAVVGILAFAVISQSQVILAKQGSDGAEERLAAGKELFTREWQPGDKLYSDLAWRWSVMEFRANSPVRCIRS